MSESETVPSEAPAETNGVDPKAEKDERKEAIEALVKSLQSERLALQGIDLASILYEDDTRIQSHTVPAGRKSKDGKELGVEVRIRDIGDQALLAAYEESSEKQMREKKDNLEACAALWAKTVVEPKELSTESGIRAVWKKLPTRFREGLTTRILIANGAGGFLEKMSVL